MTHPALAPPPVAASSDGNDLRPVLVRFTVALNRRRAYAPTHPMVVQAESALFEALTETLASRPTFTLGVAHRELLVDQIPVEQGGATARELAERLHRRGVGAITLSTGLTFDVLQAALQWLAFDPNATTSRLAREGGTGELQPAPTDEADVPPTAPGLAIGKIAYSRLALSDEDAETAREIATLWRSLAAVAFDTEFLSTGRARAVTDDAAVSSTGAGGGRSASGTGTSGGGGAGGGPSGGGQSGSGPAGASTADQGADGDHADGDGLPADGDGLPPDDTADDITANELANAISERRADEEFLGRVGSAVRSVASRLRVAPPAVRQEVAARLRAVLAQLSQSELGAIIRAAGQGAERRQFITSLLDVMPASAIVEWLELTANATDQQLSHHLLRILTKLSVHAGNQRTTANTPDAFRDATQALVAGWELDDPNPIEHGELLDFIAGTERPTVVSVADPAAPPADVHEGEREAPDEDAVRLVYMACEIDTVGSDAIAAAQTLVMAGHTALLFAWLASAPGRDAAQQLRSAVTAPDTLLRAMLREPFDASSSRTLLADLDITSAPTLLDALERARPRSARRVLLTTLTAFGPALAPLLLQRLEASPPWYFVRNLLLLLRDVSTDASAVNDPHSAHRSLHTFLEHTQEQVRLEALRLLLEIPDQRDAAIRRTLDDRSERVVALAIDALVSDLASASGGNALLNRDMSSRLMRIADTHGHAPELCARAIRALVHTSNPMVRDWLVVLVRRTSRILRRTVLADAQPSMLAALQVLAVRYATDPRVTPLIALARGRDARDPRRIAVERAQEGNAT